MPWVDASSGAQVSDPMLLQSLGTPTAPPTLASNPDAARNGQWIDQNGQSVTDPLILKSLGAPSTASGMGGDRPDSYGDYQPPSMATRAGNLLTSATPFGYGDPGSLTDIGNSAFRGVRTAGQSAITGAVNTAAGALNLLGAAGAGGGASPYGMPDNPADLPSSLITKPFYENVMPEYKPTTLPGRIAQTMVGGGLLAAPMGVAASALGALSGGGAELGGEAGGLLGQQFGPAAREGGALLGSLALGGAPGLLHSGATSAEGIAARRFGQLTPAQWEQGIQRQDLSRNIGMPLLATEALDAPAGHAMTADLMRTPQGAQINEAITQQRPGQVQAGVTDQILDPISAQPINTGATAEKVQNAAEGVIQSAERYRSAQTKPFYQAAATDQVPAPQVAGFVNQLDSLIAQDPGNLNPSLRQARSALVQSEAVPAVPPTRGQYVNGAYQPATPGTPAQPMMPFTDIATLDRARKMLRDKVELPPIAADAAGKTAAVETGGTLSDLRDAMTRASPDFAQGRALHAQISEDTVAPLQRSPIGTLAARSGIPENTGIQSQINTIANPATARPDQIMSVASNLNMVDRTAFPELARTYFENAFDQAQKGPRGAPQAPQQGIAFRQAVNGTPQQQANNQAILAGVAQAHGIPTAGLAAGFDNAMATIERMGLIPGSGSPTHERGVLAKEAESGPLNYASNLAIDKPGTLINLNPASYYRARAYRTLSDAIVSPDGVQQLRRLSMYNPGSRQAQAIVGQLAGLTAEQGAIAAP